MGLDRSRVAALSPRWHVWQGVTGICYARLLLSSPPVVRQAHNWTALRERIEAAEQTLSGPGGEAPPSRA